MRWAQVVELEKKHRFLECDLGEEDLVVIGIVEMGEMVLVVEILDQIITPDQTILEVSLDLNLDQSTLDLAILLIIKETIDHPLLHLRHVINQ